MAKTPTPKIAKPRGAPLLRGSLWHAAAEIKALVKEGKVPPATIKLLRSVLQKVEGQKDLASAAQYVEELSRQDGSLKSLAEILSEGTVAGRMPRRPGARVPEETPRLGFERQVDRAASLEPFPGELNALRKTGKLTAASEAAAKRLGFDVDSTGSAMGALYQFIYATLYRQNLKQVGHEGQFSNIFGAISEFGLSTSEVLSSAEDEAVQIVLADMAKTNPKFKPFDYDAMEKSLPFPVNPDSPDAVANAIAVMRKYRPAEGIIDIELYSVRDATGQTGRLVTDRLRGLLDRRKTPPEFVIVSIGESKAASGYTKIFGQIATDVERLIAGFRAPEGGSGAVQSFEPAKVSFGKRLVVSSLSEVTPPEGHRATLVQTIQNTFESAGRKAPDIVVKEIQPGTIFADARTVAGELQAALTELGAKAGSEVPAAP
jgi:hypothetical protein